MSDNQAAMDDGSALNEWDKRPWVLAGLLGLAGLLVHFISEDGDTIAWRMAVTAALVFGSLALAFTLSPEKWRGSAIFSGVVALVMAGIAWRATSAGDRYSDAEFWVAAGVLAVTLALPLFQASFHRLRWKTSYKATHFHVWTDAITGAGALAFVGLSWALIAILSELFSTINIDLLKDLIEEGWFGWTFSGAAFGAALGVLRNQLKIIGTLQNVVLLVLSILAVPLAIALVIFLLSVAVSGLNVLWDATNSATPLLLAIAVGCFVLANSVVRDEDELASNSKLLRMAGFILALGILPLAAMAALSMGTRIAQHGLSPERLWALIAISVAVAYGVAYFVSAIRGGRGIMQGAWREHLRQSNLHLAVLTCVIAFILALPIFNFGAISASNQLARLESGAVSAEDFDYAALRWDFGDAGREALAELTQSDDAEVAEFALAAQNMEYRYDYRRPEDIAEVNQAPVEVESEEVRLAVRNYLQENIYLCREGCRVVEVGTHEDKPLMALVNSGRDPQFLIYDPDNDSVTTIDIRFGRFKDPYVYQMPEFSEDATIELRPFEGQQLYIDGEPASAPFE